MESSIFYFDKCANCQTPYDVDKRKPVIIQDCGETICESCYTTFLQPQENIFKCPFDKIDHQIFSNKILYNLHYLKKLKEKIIYCVKHPEEKAIFFCNSIKKLICTKCFCSDQKLYQELKEIDFNELIKDMSIIIENADEVYQQIEVEKQKLLKIQELAIELKQFAQKMKSKELVISSDQFMQRLNEAKEFFEKNNKNQQSLIKFNQFTLYSTTTSKLTNLISQQDYDLVQKWFDFKFSANLIYQSQKDGFTSQAFHQKCDNQGPTLSLIKADNDIVIGGYASQSWNANVQNYQLADGSFIFTLHPDHKTKHTIYQNQVNYAIYCHSSYHITFGQGHGIYISNQCNENNSSYTNLGYTYSLPAGAVKDQDSAKNYLVGKLNFKVKEIEVYKIVKC